MTNFKIKVKKINENKDQDSVLQDKSKLDLI
jgi:hypothetical protein